MSKIKHIYLTFLLIITIISCNTPTISKVVAAYPDGSTKTELILSPDEKIKYEQISYFDDGKISIKGKFENNKRHGRWESYFMDGKLNSINNYKNGDYDGEYLVYDKEGKVILKGAYKNGKKFGEWITYGSDGKKLDIKWFDKEGNEIKK